MPNMPNSPVFQTHGVTQTNYLQPYDTQGMHSCARNGDLIGMAREIEQLLIAARIGISNQNGVSS